MKAQIGPSIFIKMLQTSLRIFSWKSKGYLMCCKDIYSENIILCTFSVSSATCQALCFGNIITVRQEMSEIVLCMFMKFEVFGDVLILDGLKS